MRAVAALAAVLVLLAGCSGQAGLQQQDETGGEEGGPGPGGRSAGGRSSDPGNGTGADPPHDTVTILDAPLSIASAGSQSFDVEVPANATIADWSFGWTTPVFMADQLTVALDGCGSAVHSGLVGSYGGPGSIDGRVCKDAASGAWTFTVSNGPVGFLDGVVRLKVHIPTGNATA